MTGTIASRSTSSPSAFPVARWSAFTRWISSGAWARFTASRSSSLWNNDEERAVRSEGHYVSSLLVAHSSPDSARSSGPPHVRHSVCPGVIWNANGAERASCGQRGPRSDRRHADSTWCCGDRASTRHRVRSRPAARSRRRRALRTPWRSVPRNVRVLHLAHRDFAPAHSREGVLFRGGRRRLARLLSRESLREGVLRERR